MPADGSCLVWWAGVADYQAGHESLLSDVEIDRSTRLRRDEDRVRQKLGAVLLRVAAGSALDVPPSQVRVDRTCPRCTAPHGRPMLPGTGLHASITHSGDLVGLALTAVAPVGLDVERVADVDIEGLSRLVLHPDEKAPDPEAFFTFWTRKEAVVKATGDGLGAPLAQVRVSDPAGPPQLLAYPERAAPPAAYLVDLRPADGYRAALALLAPGPVRLTERRGAP
jgi:4'-phosphopantetheinyl transferase